MPENLSRAFADEIRQLLIERGTTGRQLAIASGGNCAAELGNLLQVRLPVALRREVVAHMRGAGM